MLSDKDDIELHIESLEIKEKSCQKDNKYGRAFVTVIELEPGPPLHTTSKKRKYPIQRLPSLFYATKPIE